MSANKQATKDARNNPEYGKSQQCACSGKCCVAQTSWYDDSCQDLYLWIFRSVLAVRG